MIGTRPRKWSMIAAAVALSASPPMPAAAGIGDSPLPRFADGSPSVVVALITGVVKRNRLQTDFLCTSLDDRGIHIGVEIFSAEGALLNDVTAGVGAATDVAPGATVTIGTSATATFLETGVIPLAGVSQGSARIVASSDRVRCNALVVDDAVSPPTSLAALPPGVRPAAVTGTMVPALPQFADGRAATHVAWFPGAVKRGRNETNVMCTSLADRTIAVGVEILSPAGGVQNDIAAGNGALVDVAPGATVTFGTTGTAAFLETTVITLPGVAQGTARVVSDSGDLVCSAWVLDAAVTPPVSMGSLGGATLDTAAPPPWSRPLPRFRDGKAAFLIQGVAGVVRRARLQTVFLCTSLDASPVDIGVEVFSVDGAPLTDISAAGGALLDVAPGQTVTIGTSATLSFLETLTLAIPGVAQGSARLVASSPRVRCNTLVLDDLVTPATSLAALGEGARPQPSHALAGRPMPSFSDQTPATHALAVPGVTKRGRIQTDFVCTSTAATAVHLGVEVFDSTGLLLNRIDRGEGTALGLAPGATVTFGTTGSAGLLESVVIAIPGVAQGWARIVSNSPDVLCRALLLDAAVTPPQALSELGIWADIGAAMATTPTPTASPSATATNARTSVPTATPQPTASETAAVATATMAATAIPSCSGDCDGDEGVTVDELVRAVNIGLGNVAAEQCRAADGDGDGAVTVDEIVRALNRALDGC